MIFLFLTFCFSISLLFFLPPPLHKPLKQGLFLFTLTLAIFSYAIGKIIYFQTIYQKWDHFLIFGTRKSERKYIWLGVAMVLLGFVYHGYALSITFASNFQFHDADYVGMQEVIKNLGRGEGYHSTYYSVNGQGSYLSHHFSPMLLLFLPFECFMPGRWGYAIGVYFYLCLGTLLWVSLMLKMSAKESGRGRLEILFLILLCLLSNIYIYRLGTSYHFEVLVYPLSAIFFFYFESGKINLLFFVSLLSLLLVKEDIAIYLVLFLFPLFFQRFRKEWNIRKSSQADSGFLKSPRLDPLSVTLVVGLLYMGFVFLILPILSDTNAEQWIGALSKEYRPEFKQVTGLGSSLKIFIELSISMGFGFVTSLGSLVGLFLIYLTHALSNRPWHHEVYSYYCYTILPFLIYAGSAWMKEKKTIPAWTFFLLLALTFARNIQDSNFPIDLEKLTWKGSDAIQGKEVQNEFEQIKIEYPLIQPYIIFTQYNLSFYMPNGSRLYPLNQIQLKKDLCKLNVCYLIIAPEFTEEKLVTSSFISAKRSEFVNDKMIFKGKWLEVWKSN